MGVRSSLEVAGNGRTEGGGAEEEEGEGGVRGESWGQKSEIFSTVAKP